MMAVAGTTLVDGPHCSTDPDLDPSPNPKPNPTRRLLGAEVYATKYAMEQEKGSKLGLRQDDGGVYRVLGHRWFVRRWGNY